MSDDETIEYEDRYSLAGEAYIVRGLAKEIIEELGEEKAEKIFYNAGKRLGEAFAGKKGSGYDPEEALEILKKHTVRGDYYTIGVLEGYVEKDTNFVTAIQIVNCVVQRILGSEFTKRPLLCKLSKGYIEGALSKLTGLEVKEEIFKSENEPFPTCHGRITFFKKQE
jgi:predicted hydrocarbon binding protein